MKRWWPLLALLGACATFSSHRVIGPAPEGFLDREHAAAAEAVRVYGGELPPVGDVELMPLGPMQHFCPQNPCVGVYIPGGWEEDVQHPRIKLPPVAAFGRCSSVPRSQRAWARIAIHEFLHSAGYHHGPRMDAAEVHGWVWYMTTQGCNRWSL